MGFFVNPHPNKIEYDLSVEVVGIRGIFYPVFVSISVKSLAGLNLIEVG